MKFNMHLIYVNSKRNFALEEDIFGMIDGNILIESAQTDNALISSLSTALNECDVILTIGDEYSAEQIREIVKVDACANSKSYNFKDGSGTICAHGIRANGQSIISITDPDPHFVFNAMLASWICKQYNMPLPEFKQDEEIASELDEGISADEETFEEMPKPKKMKMSLALRLTTIAIVVIAIAASGFLAYDGFNGNNYPADVYNPHSFAPPFSLYWPEDDDFTVIEHFGIWDGEGETSAKIDADYNYFIRLTLSGAALTRDEDYKVTYGSTIITLYEGFLATLGAGTHTFVAEFTGDKTANITLTISDSAESFYDSVVDGDPYLSSSIAQSMSASPPPPQSANPPADTTQIPPLPQSIAPVVSLVPSIAPPTPTSTAPATATRIRIRNELAGNAIVEGDAITLVAYVLEAEMGSHWPLEALRAQAVAAYSWLWFNGARDFNRTPPQLPMRTPGARARQAAADTYGTLIMSGGRVAEAMFFAMSAGVTTSSQYVWTANRPYLQSVQATHENASTINNFQTTRTIPAATLATAISQFTAGSANHDEINLTTIANRQNWLHVVYCPTGVYVRHVYFGTARGARNRVSGNALRMSVLTSARVGAGNNLRSHAFTVTHNPANDTFTFTVRGFGHGVGMSQEGARVLANQGRNYRQILQHYFRGITFGSK